MFSQLRSGIAFLVRSGDPSATVSSAFGMCVLGIVMAGPDLQLFE